MRKYYFLFLFIALNSEGLGQQPRLNTSATLLKSTMKRVREAMGTYRFETPSGNISIGFATNQSPASSNLATKISPLNSALCLSKEEVRGQKIERPIVIADPSQGARILPGAVIDGSKLLETGEFAFLKMDKRKPFNIYTTSNLATKAGVTITPAAGENIEMKVRNGLLSIIGKSNLKSGMPNKKSNQTAEVSRMKESNGLKIGASFFYMGVSAENNFSYSSDRYNYMYLFKFEQECLSVLADQIDAPSKLFTDNEQAGADWFYVSEVTYGRRLYVLIESEMELNKISNQFTGGVDWGFVSAAYSQRNTSSTFRSKSRIRVITEGGIPLAITDTSKINETIDKYLNVPYNQMDIVPLSFNLSTLTGQPVSMVSRAFLNSDYCLKSNKVRVRVSKIECIQDDDGASDNSEQVYGSVNLFLYSGGKVVLADGKTPAPYAGFQMPSGQIVYAKESAPLRAKRMQPLEFGMYEQGKYVDLTVNNLDMVLEIVPFMKEEDDLGDDEFLTDNKVKKSFRQMLLEGTVINTFQFRDGKSVVNLVVEINPL